MPSRRRRRAPFAKMLTGSLRPPLVGMLAAVCAAMAARGEDASPLRPWRDYRVIMWVGDTVYQRPEKFPLFLQRLREMGVTTAMVHHDGDPAPFVTNHFPYYVENIVNRGLCLKFNSKVTDWDKFVTGWAKEGRPESAFVRDYSLDDPGWRGWARKEMESVVRKNRPHEPLAYCIRDELSTTLSANPFDYDYSPSSLQGFRTWLKLQYPDLAALNAEWETSFASWEDVRPFSTDQIKNRMASGDAAPRGKPDWQALQQLRFDPTAPGGRTRWNFAPWADFRSYMDVSLAQALAYLRDSSHSVDPATPVGIEGTQMPNTFGGYDLWRLSQALDWVEPYDIGCAREILGSFMPGRPILTTVGEPDGRHAQRRLWHLLLEGDRGCLVWWSEDSIDWKSPGYEPTPRAKAITPALKEMTSPVAELFLRAEREFDPVWLLYSQASIQADWLIESTVDGSTWPRRFSSFEASNNRQARARVAWLKLLQDLSYSPRFLAGEELVKRGLAEGDAALVLPGALALSDAEAGAVKRFIAARGRQRAVLGDGPPGAFDGHARLRSGFALGWGIGGALDRVWMAQANLDGGSNVAVRQGDISAYAANRLKAGASGEAKEWTDWGRAALGFEPPIGVPAPARVRVHRYRVGKARLAAFERNVSYQMSEDLSQAGGNEALEEPVTFEATFPGTFYVYDLAAGRFLGRAGRMTLTVDPWKPTLLALLDEEAPEGEVVKRLRAAARER